MHRRLDVDMMSSRRVWLLRSEALKGFDIHVALIRDSWVAFFHTKPILSEGRRGLWDAIDGGSKRKG